MPVFSRIRSHLPFGRLLLLSAVLFGCDATAEGNSNGQGDGTGDAAVSDSMGMLAGKGSGRSVRPTTPLPPDALMLQRVSIDDPGVIAAMPAMSVLVPMGWRSTGGVIAGSGTCSAPYSVNWQATSPDGRSTISIFPTEVWSTSNTAGSGDCMPASFASAREYLEARIQRAHQGVRIMDYRERPDYARSAADYAQRMQQTINSMGLSMRVRADGGEILFAYTQDGEEMRGVAGVSAVFFASQLPNPMGGTPLISSSGETLGSFAASAPEGQLDFELVEAARRSIVPNGAWLERLFALQQQLGAAAVQGTRERAAIIVAGGAAATKSNIESFQRMSGFDRATSGSGGGEMYPGGLHRRSHAAPQARGDPRCGHLYGSRQQ